MLLPSTRNNLVGLLLEVVRLMVVEGETDTISMVMNIQHWDASPSRTYNIIYNYPKNESY